MPDDTTPEQLRIAHRRGHDTLMHERAREDIARANVLVTDNGAVLEVGELFDGEMLVVDGDQIVSEPIPGGGGGGSTWHDGSGAPAGGLGSDGDYYLNTANGDIYTKELGVWTLLWDPAPSLPTGGNAQECLFKVNGTDYNVTWRTPQISADIAGLGAGVATFLGTPSSANLRAALTDETGTGSAVFATSPALVTPNLGVPSAVDLTNGTNLPASSVVWSGAALQSPVLGDDVMMIEQATGGAKRRVIAADVAKSAYAYFGFVLAPVTGIGSAPVNIFTTSTLPVGSYIMSFTAAFGVALSGGATSFTVDLAVASGTVSAIAGFAGKPGHTTTIGQQGSAGITSLPFALVTTFTNSNQNSLCVYSAIVTVSAPAVITINVSLNTTSTGFVRAGSFLQFAR